MGPSYGPKIMEKLRMLDGHLTPIIAPDTDTDHSSIPCNTTEKTVTRTSRPPPGAEFGEVPLPPRRFDAGMGVAVARRTVFRKSDNEDFGRVADRVSAGNMSLLGDHLTPDQQIERARLRNAIVTGTLLTSGRHLQQGDETQNTRSIEVFSNCASAITSFTKFYLLLNGAGVGRSYDDELVVVDWHQAPTLLLYLSPEHQDYPHSVEAQCRLGVELGLLPHDTIEDPDGIMRRYLDANLVSDLSNIPADAIYHRVGDSREGWAKALEVLEAMTFRCETTQTLVLDYSDVRAKGSPIAGMQNRPASGPLSIMSAFLNLRNHIIRSATRLPLWEQALRADHYFSVEVQVGGARRAARMATKNWRDPDIFAFIRIKSNYGLWSANHSVMVDTEFWELVNTDVTEDHWSQKAHAVFDEVTRCAFINGEPGFINGDALEDNRTGFAWQKPVHVDGRDFCSSRYKADEACGLLAELSHRASLCRYAAVINPCAEVTLHVTGGVCVIADFAPLLACPVPLETLIPGQIPDDITLEWDARVEAAIRLGVRLLIRTNMMDALYHEEIDRTNRIGIGPTGLHDYAWMRFGFDFNDLLDESVSAPFWTMLERFSAAGKDEGNLYSDELELNRPVTSTTIKPSGTCSKLFGLTEGAHLPARLQYLRWVQFKGIQDQTTKTWELGSDPLLSRYSDLGYPMKPLKSFPGMTAVGFPTVPLILRLGIGQRVVTANDASPTEQYQWLRLLEHYWIGEDQGNQISYTMKVMTDRYDLETFREIVRINQPTIRCCAILPSRPDVELGYEYLPEEEVSLDRFTEIVSHIKDSDVTEDIDIVHLQCSSGVCPII